MSNTARLAKAQKDLATIYKDIYDTEIISYMWIEKEVKEIMDKKEDGNVLEKSKEALIEDLIVSTAESKWLAFSQQETDEWTKISIYKKVKEIPKKVFLEFKIK